MSLRSPRAGRLLPAPPLGALLIALAGGAAAFGTERALATDLLLVARTGDPADDPPYTGFGVPAMNHVAVKAPTARIAFNARKSSAGTPRSLHVRDLELDSDLAAHLAAYTGLDAPGVGGSSKFGALVGLGNGFSPPIVNREGFVAFFGSITLTPACGGAASSTGYLALWNDALMSPLEGVAWVGFATPSATGVPTGAKIYYFENDVGTPPLEPVPGCALNSRPASSRPHVAFYAGYGCGVQNLLDLRSMWVSDRLAAIRATNTACSGPCWVIAQSQLDAAVPTGQRAFVGDSVRAIFGAGNDPNPFGWPSLNDESEAAFFTSMAIVENSDPDPCCTSPCSVCHTYPSVAAILSETAGSRAIIAYQGGDAPLLDSTVGTFGFMQVPVAINNAGRTAFCSGISGGGMGIWRHAVAGGLEPVVQTGELLGSDTVSFVDAPVINHCGSLAFKGAIEDGKSFGEAVWKVTRDGVNSVRRVALVGESAPGGFVFAPSARKVPNDPNAGGEVFQAPFVNKQGDIAFLANIGPDAEESTERAVFWSLAGGPVEMLVRTGMYVDPSFPTSSAPVLHPEVEPKGKEWLEIVDLRLGYDDDLRAGLKNRPDDAWLSGLASGNEDGRRTALPDRLETTGMGVAQLCFWMKLSDGTECVVVARRDCSCPGDANCDGMVNSVDLAVVLGAWGAEAACEGELTRGDVTGDGAVGSADYSLVIGAWGACP